MEIFHRHPRTRTRPGHLAVESELTLQQTADEFSVHLNSVEQLRTSLGWQGCTRVAIRATAQVDATAARQQALGELAHSEGGTVAALSHHLKQRNDHVSISDGTAARYLKEMKFSYKRYRYS